MISRQIKVTTCFYIYPIMASLQIHVKWRLLPQKLVIYKKNFFHIVIYMEALLAVRTAVYTYEEISMTKRGNTSIGVCDK